MLQSTRKLWMGSIIALPLFACSGPQTLQTVDYVDLERFMGDWYVIANIPTWIETSAYNAIESYELDDDGTIATRFTFREDSFDGDEKVYSPRGFILNTETNAEWGMRFVWPIKADYRIVYLDPEYSITIIARNKRDYVWLMAREPNIPDSEYDRLITLIGEMGYELEQVRKVPQKW